MQSQHRPFLRLADIMSPEANSFGVLRLLMATFVLISHSYLYAAGTDAAEPLQPWLGRSLGEYAVQVFFILSGVLVAQSFDRSRSILNFAAARVLRIFPALIVCVAVTAFVLGPMVSRLTVGEYFADIGLYAYVAKTLALTTGAAPLPGVFETLPYAGYVNSSLWTLKYEVLCYVILAALGVAGLFEERWRKLAIAGLAVLVGTVTLGLPAEAEAYGFSDNLRYFIVFFFSGVLAYIARRHLIIHGAALAPLAVLFVCLAKTPLAEISAALFLGYAALWLATKALGLLRAVCNKFDASYGIYIFAGPTQQTLLWLMPGLPPVWLSLVAFAIVLPTAIVSWIVIEKPAMKLRSLITARLRKREPVAPLPAT
ncbi:acyltransferase family protein [Hyphomicrobium facile]|nr:acyltransferase [Hyphomicrobium facile]